MQMKVKLIGLGLIILALSFGIWQYGLKIESQVRAECKDAITQAEQTKTKDVKDIDSNVKKETITTTNRVKRDWLLKFYTYAD